MKVLVTGGSGFVGRYVCENLRARGCHVTVYDTTKPAFAAFPGVGFIEGSVLDAVKLTRAIENADCVMHLAGILGTAETIENPLLPAKVNILGSLTVFEACRRFDRRGCNIGVGNHWMQNSYAITKNAAERFALMYNKEFTTEIAVVRGLNAYGPYQKSAPVRKVIPNLILPALRGEDLTIYGSGEQVMDFIYVSDLAEILVRALLDDHDCFDTVMEAGSGRETTINYVAEWIIALSGSTSAIKHVEMRPGEMPDSKVVADTKTLEPLGCDPQMMTSLDVGLTASIEYYRTLVRATD